MGAALRAEMGRVAGPPRGVLAAVPGVRKVGVLRLPGVGPALMARRKGVVGWVCAVAFGVAATSGDRRCFLRADSDMVALVEECDKQSGLVDERQDSRGWRVRHGSTRQA